MKLTLPDLEALVLFLRDRSELWTAHCQLHGADPDRIVLELAQAHGRLVLEKMKGRKK